MSYTARHRLYGWRKAKREWLKIPLTDGPWGRTRSITCEPEPTGMDKPLLPPSTTQLRRIKDYAWKILKAKPIEERTDEQMLQAVNEAMDMVIREESGVPKP